MGCMICRSVGSFHSVWYAIGTFSNAFRKLRPVWFPEIPARILLRRDCCYVKSDRDNGGSVLAAREMRLVVVFDWAISVGHFWAKPTCT